jgi:hypothetical protein
MRHARSRDGDIADDPDQALALANDSLAIIKRSIAKLEKRRRHLRLVRRPADSAGSPTRLGF